MVVAHSRQNNQTFVIPARTIFADLVEKYQLQVDSLDQLLAVPARAKHPHKKLERVQNPANVTEADSQQHNVESPPLSGRFDRYVQSEHEFGTEPEVRISRHLSTNRRICLRAYEPQGEIKVTRNYGVEAWNPVSMISVNFALGIRDQFDRFDQVPPGLKESPGRTYWGAIEVCWWYYGSETTQKETFLVVDELPGGKDAIIRQRDPDVGTVTGSELPFHSPARVMEVMEKISPWKEVHKKGMHSQEMTMKHPRRGEAIEKAIEMALARHSTWQDISGR